MIINLKQILKNRLQFFMPTIRHVLIIEDIADVAAWLQQQVRALFPAAESTTAATLLCAQRIIATTPVDLALVDLGLPDGDGAQLIPLIKAHQPTAVCVVTTIFDDAEHMLGALRAGADGYLLKDEPETEFSAQLAGILAGRPPLSASIARALLQQFHPLGDEPIVTLTARETDILTLTAKGLSVKHAAELLGIRYHTAAGYLKDVYRKLQVNSRAEATIKAIRLGLVNSG